MNPFLSSFLNRLPLAGGLFPNAYYVARREYTIRARNRSFAILTIALALVGLALALLPLGISLIGGEKPVRVAVYSTAENLPVAPASTLQAILNASTSSTSGTDAGSSAGTGSGETTQRYTVNEVSDPAPARQEVQADELNGLLTLSRGSDGDLQFDYFTKDSATSPTLQLVQQAASRIAISDRLARAGVSQADSARIFAPTAFATTPADPNAARQSEEDYLPSYILAYVFVILAFMAIQLYGNWVAASVAEEKSSRVMELLITAATPRQLLFGKVLGTGAAGLTQYGAVVAAALVGFVAQGALGSRLLDDPSAAASIPGLTPLLVIGFGVYFILGFILYAVLYAAAGSMASRQEDVQQIAVPLTFIGIGGYLLSFIALPLIEAPWVQVASWIPFVSSFLFPARMALSPPAPWEYVLSIGLLVVAIFGSLWVAARIYAAGVLLYGQRPTLRAIVRATIQAR